MYVQYSVEQNVHLSTMCIGASCTRSTSDDDKGASIKDSSTSTRRARARGRGRGEGATLKSHFYWERLKSERCAARAERTSTPTIPNDKVGVALGEDALLVNDVLLLLRLHNVVLLELLERERARCVAGDLTLERRRKRRVNSSSVLVH